GLATGFGVWCGSAAWGIAAALGVSAIMLSYAWVAEALRIAGALYLIWLGYKSLRSAIGTSRPTDPAPLAGKAFLRGLLIHLTNPKAILSWGAVYSVALPPGAPWAEIWSLFVALSSVSALVFLGYGILFAAAPIRRGYARAGRWIEGVFGVLFGAAGIRLLSVRV
ncbi:MAG: LysE family transporter, partial [Pseudomonadota bacterium]